MNAVVVFALVRRAGWVAATKVDRENRKTVSVRPLQGVRGVVADVRGAPLSPVGAHPGLGNLQARGEEASRQEALPAPALRGEPQLYGGSRSVPAPFGAPFDEVAPGRQQEAALEQGVDPPAEGDGFAAVVGAAVPHQAVQQVDGKHGAVADAGLWA